MCRFFNSRKYEESVGVQVDNKVNQLSVRGCLPLLPIQFTKILAEISILKFLSELAIFYETLRDSLAEGFKKKTKRFIENTVTESNFSSN